MERKTEIILTTSTLDSYMYICVCKRKFDWHTGGTKTKVENRINILYQNLYLSNTLKILELIE